MEIYAISRLGTESDTSQEEFEDFLNNESLKNDKENFEELNPFIQLWKRDSSNILIDLDFERIDPFRFMILDIESSVSSGDDFSGICNSIIRLFGVSYNGASVCLNIPDFLPYFYALPSDEIKDSELPKFISILEQSIENELLKNEEDTVYHNIKPKLQFEVIHPDEANVYDFFNFKKEEFIGNLLKISCSVPKFIWIASEILKSGLLSFSCRFDVYESNLNNNIRFLTDRNLACCSWIEILPDKFLILNSDKEPKTRSNCQIELEASYKDIKLWDSDNSNKIPPLRIFSFDIEVMVRPPNFTFPPIGFEKVLQISNVISDYPSKPFAKIIFTLGSCDPIPGVTVMSFNDEIRMLSAWRHFVTKIDPDIITGYNIQKFDIPYLLARGKFLNIPIFGYLGRLKSKSAIVREYRDSPKRLSNRFTYDNKIHGRVIFDLYPLFWRHTLRNNGLKLNQVAQRYLGDCKNDVSYKDIFKLQNTSSATRKIIAEYCMKDSELVFKLLHLMPGRIEEEGMDFLKYYILKARNCGTPLRYLVTKSDNYNFLIMRIRKEKNPHIIYGPVTPPRKLENNNPPLAPKKSKKSLFLNSSSDTESEEDFVPNTLIKPRVLFTENEPNEI